MASPQPHLALHSSRRQVSIAVAAATAGVLAVTLFGLLVARGSAMTQTDLAALTLLNQLHVGALGAATTLVYTVFSPIPAIGMTAAAAVAIWVISRRLPVALTFAVAVALAWLPSALVKALVHRPRPDPHLLPHPFATQPSDASYPSGHEVFVATVAVVVFLTVRGTLARVLVAAAGFVVVTAVGLSLAIDGVHYPTDVAASVVWACATVPAIVLILRQWAVPFFERLSWRGDRSRPAKPRSRRQDIRLPSRRIFLGILGVLTVLLAAVLLRWVGGIPVGPDASWQTLVASHQWGPAVSMAQLLATVGSPLGAAVVTGAVVITQLFLRRWRAAFALAAAVGLGAIGSTSIKLLAERPRHLDGLADLTSFSFPSGHTTWAATFATTLALGLPRLWAVTLAGGWIAFMAWGRTEIGAHWLSDVVAGALLGISLALIIDGLLTRLNARVSLSSSPIVLDEQAL